MKKILLIMLITLPLALSGQSKGKKNVKATFEVCVRTGFKRLPLVLRVLKWQIGISLAI